MTQLSLNEIKARALTFSKDHEDDEYEMGDTQKFLIDFFDVFGIDKRYIDFEKRVNVNGQFRRIDGFYPAKILVEQKSKGKDLDSAYQQARAYLQGLDQNELPTHILVSDFEHLHLYDLEKGSDHYSFTLKNFANKIELFGFLTGRKKVELVAEDPVNIKASKLMGNLHDTLAADGYSGHDLEMFLVRVLFCLFAEDTGIFKVRQFQSFIEQRTASDGSDVGSKLDELFGALNTAEDSRLGNLDEDTQAFPYINGRLFAERIRTSAFNTTMREQLLVCCSFDWSQISPAIFGSLFQYVMDPAKRREMGAHYTDETNIFKLIKPLFLDDLQAEFLELQNLKRNRTEKLGEFQTKLANLHFLDPACGCGNFLVVTYRELRQLELDVLLAIHSKDLKGQKSLFDIGELVQLNVDQFYGIELEEFSAKIAEVSMWLMDHLMNRIVAAEFGQLFARIPLKTSASIVHGNALQIDWNEVLPSITCNYIIGNPPFYGARNQNKEQKKEVLNVFSGIKGVGILDYVCCWYKKASEYIKGRRIAVAFVSTNSITQGEQVGILWKHLLEDLGMHIQFAHQTFKWSNQASGKAQVFVVIIGFANTRPKQAKLYEYETVRSEPHEILVKNISGYLLATESIFIQRRSKPISNVPKMIKGNYYANSAGLIVEKEDLDLLLAKEPKAKEYIRQLIGANEFLNNINRYCLWLVNCSPSELKAMPLVLERIDSVRKSRLQSSDKGMHKLALTPAVFRETNNPDSCLVIPVVSSEKRNYIPMGFIDKAIISTNGNLIIPNAALYHFGILTSQMHMAWTRHVCGRLEGRYRYSKDIVYNNFVWPKTSKEQEAAIEVLAQNVLNARSEHPNSSLADLYDPLTMPVGLLKAHQKLDKAVDELYSKNAFKSDSERVEMLFERYEAITAVEL